jgi:hypothetical protein
MSKKNKTYKDYLSNLISFVESDESPAYDVDQILTSAGYKPNEMGSKFQAIANQSAAKSPHNWRNKAHKAHEDATVEYLKNSVQRHPRSRFELIDAINGLISQYHLKLSMANRNFNNQTDEDLESLLKQLEFLASQKSKDSSE